MNQQTDEHLEARVAHLEQDMSSLKSDVASIKARLDATLPALATKADLAEMRGEVLSEIQKVRVEVYRMANRLIMWSVGTIIAGGGLVFAILRFLGNTA